ncbi:MAG: TolC family protein [Planctomycetes bacterium]|nr:TolC family protein [Planctomycetota bacterium]
MKLTFKARWSWMVALLSAPIATSGCATNRSDLAEMRAVTTQVEARAVPADLVKKSAVVAAPQIVQASAEQEESPTGKTPAAGKSLKQRVEMPAALPGSEVPRLRVPAKKDDEKAYEAAIQKLYPSLSDPPSMAIVDPNLPTRKLTLFELEQTALSNSPLIAQAQADIVTQEGLAIQAGTTPNPVIGYEADTVGSSQTRNYQGVFVTQLIKTAGKLQVQQAIHNVDVINAQLALRQTRIDLLTQVRRQYFALLVARESIRINEAIVKFSHELYRIQVDRVFYEGSAPYEPSQLRSLAVAARGQLVNARNNYLAAWKQLTATLNAPDLELAELVDSPSLVVPQLDYDATVSHVLSNHTQARIARNMPARARLELRLAEITPIPDITFYGAVQRDFTLPTLFRTTYNTQIGMPIPIFDQNKGHILSAKGNLVRATQESTRVENDLRSRIAEAFGRFETNRYLVGTQRDQILPDLVRTYRGTYERYLAQWDQNSPEVGFMDVVFAQQNLATAIGTYLTSLTDQWAAFVDLAALLQVDSLQELQLQLLDQGAAPEPVEDRREGRKDISEILSEALPTVKPEGAAVPR